jgi:hypothetical protein
MAYSTTQIARWTKWKLAKEAELDALNDTLLELAKRNNEEVRLDTEDGTMHKHRIQSIKRLSERANMLESEIDSLDNQLNNCGVVNMVLRRDV